MPNLVKASRNIIKFIEQNKVVAKYDDEYTESCEYSQGDKLKELIRELDEAIDASTELPGKEGFAVIVQTAIRQ